MAGISYNTIGSLIGEFSVIVFCQTVQPSGLNCTQRATVDLAAMAERFGADFNIVQNRARFLAAFRCAKCGGKDLSLIMSPVDVPTPAGGHNQSNIGR